MKNATTKPVRCAIYTRVSTEHGLEQDFNFAGCPVRRRAGLYPQSGSYRLDPDPDPLRRRRVFQRFDRAAGAVEMAFAIPCHVAPVAALAVP